MNKVFNRGDEVIRADGRADGHERVFAFHAEFGDLLLEADTSLGEMFTLRLGNVLLLGFARAELDGKVAITFSGAVRNHLAIFQRENGHRHVPSVLLEEAGHPDFLCDNAGAHRQLLLNRGTLRTIRKVHGEAMLQATQPQFSPSFHASPRPG